MSDDLVNNILNMYSSTEPFKIVMPGPSNRQVANDKYPSDKELNSCHTSKHNMESEMDYVKEYKQKDDEEYLRLKNNIIFNKTDYLDNMSDISAFDNEVVRREDTAQIYRTYNFAYRPKVDLPILSMRNNIVSMIASNSVVIIRGSTGCGKTTQVPQLILDAEFEKRQHCNIIVTQPRRIAALSIAKRVSQEREWPVGTLVGYQIGLIKNICRDTRITYCTTGVLLHKLINKKHMMEYTHVILDEVHERDEDMDFLILVIKRLLRTNSTMVKVILMSATIDVDKFAKYFSTPVENKLLPAPVIDIPRGSPFDISIYYLDEIENLGNIPTIDEDEPNISFCMIEFCARIINIFDSIDSMSNDTSNIYERPAVLVFLPGLSEIEDLRHVLSSAKNADAKWDIIILHSLISTEDQENIFKKPSKDFRRIILSTNIAESSVTVPNVKYVIDFCLTKLLVTESGTNYQCLQLCWASKSNCQQRAGRAGRVMDGRVYRMVPRSFYDNILRDEALPEMLRAPLANVVLKTKLLNMGEPKALLALSLDPPNLSNLRNTILLLKEVGALLNKNDNMFDGILTPLGRVMAALPLEIHVSKLIILGHLFDILSDAIIIAASMSIKEMFNINYYEFDSTYHEKMYWAAEAASDSIANLNAFKVWRNDKVNRRINNPQQEREWARRKSLRIRSLREIDAFINDITHKLKILGIEETMGSNKNTWEKLCVDRTFIIKIIIAGAFYPNYFIKFPDILEHRKQNMEKELSFRNPMNTVILRGWPLNQPGTLYCKRFQEIFGRYLGLEDHENITVSFDGSSRVYIEYEKKNSPPTDYSFVSNCIKLRQCRIPIQIDLLSEMDARRRIQELGLTKDYGSIVFQTSNSEEPACRRYMYDKKPYPELPEQSEYRLKTTLSGPFSPTEVQLVHLVTAGMSKKVMVEATSVNSVLLDTHPDDPRGIFLVAQNISRSAKNVSNLTLRNTTLLPSTPGLASLILLIFTPYMELRRSAIGTYYTGALCGLGYDHSTGKSLFPEHDLEILFDVEITMDDLQKINKLRHWMNVAMHFDDKADDVDDDAQIRLTINCQNHIKNTFKEVIYKIRQPQVPIPISDFDKWCRYEESLFLVSARETSKKSNIYDLHKALELNEKNDELEEIIKHLLELEVLAYEDPRETSIMPIQCKLCLLEVCGIINLRAHLCSEQHIMKQRLINTTGFGDLQNLLAKLKF